MVYLPLFLWRPELGVSGSYTLILNVFPPRSGFVQQETERYGVQPPGDLHVRHNNNNMIDISNLSESELIEACPYISIMNEQKWDIETLGKGLSLRFQGCGPVGLANKDQVYIGLLTRPRDYWVEVKKEIYLLICTKDSKYADIRTHFKKKSTTTTTAIISMISATVAAQLGAVMGMITPLVALLLYGLLKVGVNSWCNLREQEFRTKPTKIRKPRVVEQKNQPDRE